MVPKGRVEFDEQKKQWGMFVRVRKRSHVRSVSMCRDRGVARTFQENRLAPWSRDMVPPRASTIAEVEAAEAGGFAFPKRKLISLLQTQSSNMLSF